MQQVHQAWPSSYEAETARLTAGGYGLGLMITHDLRFGYVVGHPGGLPGFGSFMRWLPERGVGVVALANLTYASMDLATLECLELLDDLGALPPKAPVVPAPALVVACDRLTRLLNAWDDDLADDLLSQRLRRRGSRPAPEPGLEPAGTLRTAGRRRAAGDERDRRRLRPARAARRRARVAVAQPRGPAACAVV